MYPNIRAEMARKNMTLNKLAEATNSNATALSQKLNGKRIITLNNAIAIKKALNTELTLEELFETEVS